MNIILSVADKIKYFWATQKHSFYIGMFFSVFGILSLTAYIPLMLSTALSPIITFIFYTLGRFVKEKPEIFNTLDFWKGVCAAILGNIWVSLFIFI